MYSGGNSYESQVVEYDISKDTFVDRGQNLLLMFDVLGIGSVHGMGQFYTQYDETTMYTIAETQEYGGTPFSVLLMFDLKSRDPGSLGKISTTIPDNWERSCIASSTMTASLYMTGHHKYFPCAQVFDLNSQTWRNIADMNVGREHHGCLVEETTQRLFAVGGPVSSIEYIDTHNIDSNGWVMLDDELPIYFLFHPALVAVNGIMYTIGGMDVGGYVDTVYTINAATGVVSTHSDSLPTALYGTAAVVVGDKIYAFGGGTDEEYNVDSWMTYALTASTPTNMFSEMVDDHSWTTMTPDTKDVLIIILIAINMALIAATMICRSKQRSVRVHKYEDVSVGSD